MCTILTMFMPFLHSKKRQKKWTRFPTSFSLKLIYLLSIFVFNTGLSCETGTICSFLFKTDGCLTAITLVTHLCSVNHIWEGIDSQLSLITPGCREANPRAASQSPKRTLPAETFNIVRIHCELFVYGGDWDTCLCGGFTNHRILFLLPSGLSVDA